MNLNITSDQMLAQTKTAYQNFNNRNSPFAAIRLNINLQDRSRNEIDDIVEDNFRREKDLVFKNDNDYLILMQDTTLEVAERAARRLKFDFGLTGNEFTNPKCARQSHASAYILGSSKDTKGLVIKYVDLNASFGFKTKDVAKVQPNFHEYLKWLNLPIRNGLQTPRKISLKI